MIFFNLDWAEPGPVILGWAKRIVEQLSTVHMQREQWKVN